MTARPQLSIIVPVFNEEDNIEPLVRSVRMSLQELLPWELVFVDDGSTDHTAARVKTQCDADDHVRCITFARNYGQTAAMQAGFDHARGDIVVSMDGDLQNDPQDIPRLVAKLKEGYDLVAGCREVRHDQWFSRRVPSWVANHIIGRLTGVPVRDTGCTLKAFRRETLERIHLYSDLHRFIPVIAASTAGARIAELPVRHHPRRYGTSKYGLTRIFKVLIDLLTIAMIRSFREAPLVLFAYGAVASLIISALFFVATSVTSGSLSGTSTLVFPSAALLALGLAGYLVMLGLVAELALWESRRTHLEPVPLVSTHEGRPANSDRPD